MDINSDVTAFAIEHAAVLFDGHQNQSPTRVDIMRDITHKRLSDIRTIKASLVFVLIWRP